MGIHQDELEAVNANQGSLNTPLPVAGSRRGKPGRPRNGDSGIFRKAESGHNSGHKAGPPRQEAQSRSGSGGDGASVQTTVVPVSARLLDLHSAAAYLGVSEWTIRDLEASGTVPRIRIPLPNAGELRKLLFDREDLDQLIHRWKDAR